MTAETFDDYVAEHPNARFTDWLRASAHPDWTAATEHQFVRELTAGHLDDGPFRRYLVQDYAFVETLTSAFGLVGTPFAIAVVLYLLNGDAVSESNSTLANLGGVVLLAITTILGANFVRTNALSDLGNPLSVFVVSFAVILGAATLALLAKFARETVGRAPTA